MKTERGQDMERGKTIHFSEIQLIRTGGCLGLGVMKEDKWKTISWAKEIFCTTGIQNTLSEPGQKGKQPLFFLPFSSPSFLFFVKEITGARDGKPSLSSWSTAFWGQGMLCVSFQREKENRGNREKLTNSFGQYSHGSSSHLECLTNFLFKREISVDFGKLFSCQSGNVMRDDIK